MTEQRAIAREARKRGRSKEGQKNICAYRNGFLFIGENLTSYIIRPKQSNPLVTPLRVKGSRFGCFIFKRPSFRCMNSYSRERLSYLLPSHGPLQVLFSWHLPYPLKWNPMPSKGGTNRHSVSFPYYSWLCFLILYLFCLKEAIVNQRKEYYKGKSSVREYSYQIHFFPSLCSNALRHKTFKEKSDDIGRLPPFHIRRNDLLDLVKINSFH